jgi:cell division protein FtsQ
VAPPRRVSARTAALPARRPALSIARLLPSPRSLAAGLALLGLAVAAYAGARETSVFAVRELVIVGGSPRVQAQVRKALAPEVGRSLVRIGGGELDRRVGAVPGVLSVRYDRHFPHTLRIFVTPERPVLLLRRGSEGWVVSERGRVLRAVKNTRVSTLPRTWVPKDTPVKVGATLAPENGALVASVLAPLAASAFPARVRSVRAADAELTLVLRSGLELRLGDRGDLRLKLAVARRILLLQGPDPVEAYIDVSVPERPVVGQTNSQVESTG